MWAGHSQNTSLTALHFVASRSRHTARPFPLVILIIITSP
jgi:hypothetical protein